jgi:hypothetical protein
MQYSQHFYDSFYRAMAAIPVSFVKVKSKTKPWITPVLLDLINKRWRAFREKDFILYNHYKKKVKMEIVKSKKIWSNKMCKSSKGFWSIVSNVRGKNVTKSSHHIISLFSNATDAVNSINVRFGQFFGSSTSFDKFPVIKCENVEICNETIVYNLLSRLETDKAMGSDMIPPVLLKLTAVELCRPLCHIFNLSFRHACIPQTWKIADVCPVPKTSPVKLDQLRPISLLPCVSKICEKVVINSYHSSLIKCLDVSQFAYKPKSSTVLALITIHDYILRFFDDPNVRGIRVIAFDMTHAFDSVPHNLLLQSLCNFRHEFSDSDMFLNWLNDYLCNRQQCVRLGNVRSRVLDVTSGVPQGSILGPYLFAIYMSSYQPVDSDVCVTKYADDVTLVVPVYKTDTSDSRTLMPEIENFKMWCRDHCMEINEKKTKIMNICFSRNPISPVSFFDNVTSLKVLGLIFNCKLNWSDQLSAICSKISKRLYILRVLKPLMSHDQLVFVFNQTIRAVFEYASPVFLNPGSSFDAKLFLLCKRAFRIIHGKDVASCDKCRMFDFIDRRKALSMRIFLNAIRDHNHAIHHLMPSFSKRSSRIILPPVNSDRRAKGFVFSCSEMYNKNIL